FEVDEEHARVRFARDEEEEDRDGAAVRRERREQGRHRQARNHRCSSIQRRIPASSASWAARATTQPRSLIGPPNRQRGPRPAAAITTASVDVPLATRPSSHRRSTDASSEVLTSVTVITALTSAAGSGSPSTTTIALIVVGAHTPIGVRPAVMRFDRPTVTTASAVNPEPSASATTAFSVHADVSRPIHGPPISRRSTKAGSRLSVSDSGMFFLTCRFTTARAVPSPPPTNAEDRTVSGSRAVTTTASRSIATSTPWIMLAGTFLPCSSHSRPKPDRQPARRRESAGPAWKV